MRDFGKNYDPTEIYSDSKAFEPEESLDNLNPIDNNFASTNTAIETMMKTSKITDSDFDKICKLCWEVNKLRLCVDINL